MKIKLLAAVAVLAATAGMATPAASAAESAESCAGDYMWRTTKYLHSWENESYEKLERGWDAGTFFTGPSGRRANGWVPVRSYWHESDRVWRSLLSGTNDTNDFVRSSGVDFVGRV